MSSSRDLCPKCLELGWACHCRKSRPPEAANEIERLREALEPFALYARLNDLEDRDPDDAIEVPVRDLLAVVEALSLHKGDE